MGEAQLIKTIKTLIEKGDHTQAKADQFYIAASQHLKTLKQDCTSSWAEWESLLKSKLQLSTGRASELMQIADGRKTVDEVRAGKAESVRRIRSSLRSEETELAMVQIKTCSGEPIGQPIALPVPMPKPIALVLTGDVRNDVDRLWFSFADVWKQFSAAHREALIKVLRADHNDRCAMESHPGYSAETHNAGVAAPPATATDFPDMPEFLKRERGPN